jgi:hypothetical protein
LQEGEVPLAVDTEPEHVERVFLVLAEDSSKFTQPLSLKSFRQFHFLA